MARVDLVINGRSYEVACADGQEGHLTELGRQIDRRIADLVRQVGQVGEGRLLVMAALLVADELGEARNELKRQAAAEGKRSGAPVVEACADRVEAIAQRLAQP